MNARTGTGTGEWISPWIEEWGDKIAQFAYAFTHDADTAQDIAQETFLRLEQWHNAHPERRVHGGWLYTTARHLLIDKSRQRQRRPEVSWEDGGGAAPETTSFETTVATRLSVERTLDALAPSDRECLLLFYYQDWSIDEISRHLGVKPATVRGRLFRARQRFAKAWGGESR
jgi:RNA polymerase sigma factor (sigma-70 family)